MEELSKNPYAKKEEKTETLRERIECYLRFKEITADEFCKTCGLSTGFLNNTGDNIRISTIKKIVEKYPDIDADWTFRRSVDRNLYGKNRIQNHESTLADAIRANTDSIAELTRVLSELAKKIEPCQR